jgi:threonine/homoserine/homoserine lactone efflux protein
MLITIIAGIITGYIVSIPPLGPIAFALISKAFRGETKEGMAIAFGSAFMDMVYSMIAFSGISLLFILLPEGVEEFYFNHMGGVQIALIYAGCFVVVVYGLKIMKTKIDFQQFETEKAELVHRAEVKAEEFVHKHRVQLKKDKNLFGMFVMGLMLCISSITLPASWIAIIGYIKSFKVIESNFLGGVVFSAGTFIGTALWFFTLLRLITGNKHRINRNTVSKLNVIAGFILLVLGVILFVKATGTMFNFL